MQITLPNSARLQNIGGFLRKCTFEKDRKSTFTFHPRWISVHPAVIALTACAGHTVRAAGGDVEVNIPNEKVASLRYLQRMKLFDFLGVDPNIRITEHEPAGRFIPVTRITSTQDLSAFLIEMVPLLHLTPAAALPIKYVISELVRNVLEHSDATEGAFVCAQFYRETKTFALGVADAGVGIREALAHSHPTPDDLSAITLALRPGITGTTKRLGGTEYNAGAGLFFTKSIACASNKHMVIYSGDSYFKLLGTPRARRPILIKADPRTDYNSTAEDLPRWKGTLIGIDVGLGAARWFPRLLEQISEAYNIEIKSRKQAAHKKPKFI